MLVCFETNIWQYVLLVMQKKTHNWDPTMHELYKDLHQQKNKDKQGSWVWKKSEMKLLMFT